MKQISREGIQRMINVTGGTGGSGGGGGSFDPAAMGLATEAWVEENYLSKAFFTRLFKAYGPAETEGDPDVEVVPNDLDSDITSIEAMFGFWTEQYISALGQGSGGGGGGGGSDTLADLIDVELTNPVAGQVLKYNGTKWINSAASAGTVTSVAMSVPTGFTVTGSPITVSGVLGLSFADGYSLPTTAKQTNWDAAYSWTSVSRTTLADYGITDAKFGTPGTDSIPITLGSTTQSVLTQHQSLANYYTKSETDGKFLTISFFRSLFRAYNSSNAEVQPNDGSTSTIASIKAMFGFWTEQYISALGQSSGGGGGVTLNQPLQGINQAGLSAPTTAGQILVYNGTKWAYAGNISITNLTAYAGTFNSTVTAVGSFTSQGGNFIAQNGGFKVTGKDDTYVLLAGGGTKLLSEIGGGGSVNSITIGSGGTNYTPDANGIVTLPAYPSNYVSGISVNGGNPIQPSSGIVGLGGLTTVVKVGSTSYNVSASGMVELPAYPSVSYSTVTAALGFVPAASSDLNNYLPLSAGTGKKLTGNLYFAGGGTAQRKVQFYTYDGTTQAGYLSWVENTYGNYIELYDNVTKRGIAISSSDTTAPLYQQQGTFYKILHEGNYTSYTSISSSDVTTALGYTPAASSDLSNYLPLTAGTSNPLTGILFIKNSSSAELYFGQTVTTNGCGVLTQYAANGRIGLHFLNNDNILTILTNGNVGIGTLAPSYKLDVNGSVGANTINVLGGTGQKKVNIYTYDNSSVGGYFSFAETSLGKYLELYNPSSRGGIMLLDTDNTAPLYQKNGTTYTMWHSGNDGAGSGLDADLVDGLHASDFHRYYRHTTPEHTTSTFDANDLEDGWHDFYCYVLNAGTTNNNGTLIQNSYNGTPFQLWIPDTGYYIYKRYNAGSIGGTWSKIYAGYADSAATARKLQTARTIWGQSFDGSGDVDGSLYISNVATGNYNEGIRIANTKDSSYSTICFGADPSVKVGTHANQWQIGRDNSNNFFWNVGGSVIVRILKGGNVGIGTTSPSEKLHVNGSVRIGDAVLVWDSTNAALKVQKSDGTAASFYATGAVSALGQSSSGTTYLDQATADARYLKLSGGTINGNLAVASRLSSTSGYVSSYFSVGQTTVNSSYTLYVNGTAKIQNLSFTDITGSSNETRIETSNVLLRLKAVASVYANNALISTDIRMKHIRSYASAGIEQIANAPVFNFVFTDSPQYVHLGTSAQYWQTIFPCAVDTMPDTYLAMDYGSIALASAVMVARKVQSHEERIAALEAENARLQKELNELKAA